MAKDYLNEYRKSIREEYEIQKNGIHANFLLNPTAANLRDLCLLIFKENNNSDDLTSFRLYFGFDFSIKNAHELNDDKKLNKLKSLGKFLKGKSELKNIDGLNLAAMLVSYENRPYNKFSKLPLEEKITDDDIDDISPKQKDNKEDEKQPITPILGIIDKPTEISNLVTLQKSSWFNKKNIKHVSISAVSLVIILFGINHFTSEKECMTWKENHYEEIDCNAINENPNLIIVAKDDNLIKNFKKIIPCDTTKYERNGRTCLWYGKSSNDEIDFFTALYFHPETGITLKKVTSNIMNKYGKGPCK